MNAPYKDPLYVINRGPIDTVCSKCKTGVSSDALHSGVCIWCCPENISEMTHMWCDKCKDWKKDFTEVALRNGFVEWCDDCVGAHMDTIMGESDADDTAHDDKEDLIF